MKMRHWSGLAALGLWLVACRPQTDDSGGTFKEQAANLRQFAAKGIVRELKPDGQTVVITHEVISNYMAAMSSAVMRGN